jgi:hypothetical protein
MSNCPVCLKESKPSKNPDRKRTCSKDCSKLWQQARYVLDADAREKHKASRAKSILANQDKYKPEVVSWAERFKDGKTKARKAVGPTSERTKAIMAQVNALRGGVNMDIVDATLPESNEAVS